MKMKMLAPLTITGIISAAVLAAGADQQPVQPVAVQPVISAPAPVLAPVPAPATDVPATAKEEKAPKAEDVTIRLNAPIFSPYFAKVPLAMVNDEPITMEELKKTLGTIHEGMTAESSVHRKNFPVLLKRLVNSLLIIQEARSMELDKLEEIKTSLDDYAKKTLRDQLLKAQVKDVKADGKSVDKAYKERISEWRLKSLIVDKLDDVKAMETALKGGRKFDDLYDKAIKDGIAKEGGKSDSFIPRDVIAPSMLATLEKMKTGEVSKPLALDKGYLIYRLEEKHYKEDANIKDQVQQELDAKARLKALEAFQKALIKKYVTEKKLFNKLDFENKKVKFESFLKDKRVVAEVKGEKPVTVAALAEAVAAKFYHGVERAIEGKKVNKEKRAIMDELLGTIVFDKEARARKIDESEEYRNKVRAYSNSLLFGTFVNKVVRPEITVTKDELQSYYKEHAKEYSTVDFYRLDAIAFDTPQKAEEAVDKLRKGMDFKWYKANAEGRESISKAYHDIFTGDPIARPNLPEPMQKAISGAATGDFKVFLDGKLSYAISITELQPARTKTYAEVEEVIKEAVFYEKLNQGIENWANKLRSSSEVTIYADFVQ